MQAFATPTDARWRHHFHPPFTPPLSSSVSLYSSSFSLLLHLFSLPPPSLPNSFPPTLLPPPYCSSLPSFLFQFLLFIRPCFPSHLTPPLGITFPTPSFPSTFPTLVLLFFSSILQSSSSNSYLFCPTYSHSIFIRHFLSIPYLSTIHSACLNPAEIQSAAQLGPSTRCNLQLPSLFQSGGSHPEYYTPHVIVGWVEGVSINHRTGRYTRRLFFFNMTPASRISCDWYRDFLKGRLLWSTIYSSILLPSVVSARQLSISKTQACVKFLYSKSCHSSTWPLFKLVPVENVSSELLPILITSSLL